MSDTWHVIPSVRSRSSPVLPYVGPGDIVPGFASTGGSWWGMRAYTLANALSGAAAIDVVNASTGTPTTPIGVQGDGNLNVLAMYSLGYSLAITKVYDQTGNGNHLVQAALTNMPLVAFNLFNGKAVMSFAGNDWFLSTNSISSSLYSASFVARFIGGSAIGHIWSSNSGGVNVFAGNTANNLGYHQSASVEIFAADNVWHSSQYIGDGTNSDAYLDGSPTPINLGTPVAMASTLGVGADASPLGNDPLNGYIAELGFKLNNPNPAGRFSSAEQLGLFQNQRAFWKI